VGVGGWRFGAATDMVDEELLPDASDACSCIGASRATALRARTELTAGAEASGQDERS
jgi:hypothetical protein